MALLTLAGFKSWGQETLTVCEGTTAEQIVPVFVNYFDSEGTISQYVIPSSELTAMTGGGITALKFYISYVDATTLPSVLSSAQVTCKLQEVSSAVVSSIQSGGTQVFSGNLTASNSCQELDCIFDNAYTYQGGNLLVSFEVADDGSFTWTQFFGINPGYNSAITNRGSDPNVPQKFIPKTTFTYSSCIAPTGLAASNVTATGATISWTSNGAENYDLAYGVASTFDLENPSTYAVLNTTATSVQLSGLIAETEYKCAVKAHCSDEDESAWSSAVTFMPTAIQHLTINESSSNYNEYVPFYGYYADNLTKSQFIIPATTLSAMEGADITAMGFYTTTSGYNNGPASYIFGGSWDVYFSTVNYVTMPTSYEPLDGMDKVYTGNMVISNNKMTLTFSEPYTYEGGNLMICFNQTMSTSYKHTYWKGIATSEHAARAGYGDSHGNYYFLPTTTFTYTPGATRYNVTVDNAITGGSISADPTKAAAGTTVTLSATPAFGYEFGAWVEDYEDVTIEDNQFTMPEHDVTISATFNELTQYDINCAELTEGTIYAEHDGVIITEAPAGTEVTLVAEPNAGYTLDHFTVDGEPIVGNTFTMPENDVTVSATFRRVYTLTVNDGTDVYSRAPFYGGGAYSYYTKSQFVIPASYMEDMQGGKISQLKFYLNVSSYYYSEYSNDTWDVYVKELDDPSGDWWDFYDFGTMTKVYSGSISIVNNELTITFNEPFQYNDKSLMIGFNQTQTGFNGMTYWLGSNNTTGSAGPNRCRAGWENGSQKETKPFLPKTTFTYTPGETRYNITCDDAITGGSISADKSQASAGTVVTLSANPAYGYEFGAWVEDYEDVTIVDNQFTMPEHDVNISATFQELQKYAINCATLAEGTIHAEYDNVTITEAPAGTEITLIAETNPGYMLDKFVVNGEPIDGNTYTMPASNVTVTATFISALTVYNGTTTNVYAPVYTYYGDTETSAAQFVVPAGQIPEAMENGTITTMKFYVNNCDNLTKLVKPTYACYITEVENTTMSNFIDFTSPSVKVFEGHVSLSNGNTEMVISFSTPYTYNGGNLAIAFLCTSNGGGANYCYTYFYGTEVTNGSIYRNSSSAQTKTNNFIPKTTFYYTPGATRYNITCDNAITGGTISADPVKAAAGTVVNLSATPAYGYEFGAWVENYDDVTIVDNQFTMPEHDVTISATFNALPKYAINSADVTGGTVHAEYDNVTITEAPEGTVITLVAEAAEDYIFEYFTVDGVQIEGNTYTMGTSAIEIGASFRQLQSYTITYYVNGSVQKTLRPKENAFISIVEPSSTVIPAGTTFAGWSREDITTYQTTEPVFVGNTEHPTEDCSLYAVLSYSEMGGATAWTKVTEFSELNDNDVVIIGAVQNGNSGYTMNEFSTMGSSATCPALPATFSNDGTTITELPEGTTHFTVTKYPYNYGAIYLQGESGKNLSSFWNFNLNIPAGWEEYVGDDYNDVINFDNGKLQIAYNDVWDELYVILHDYGQYGIRFGVEQIAPDIYYAAYLYKQQGTLTTYYMTSVLGFGGADEHIAANTEATNVVIAKNAKLTVDNGVILNVEGICLSASHDAAQLVVADGGQLIHNNAGVLATMKKHINGIEWYTISSPLAAGNTAFADVTNLIPNNNIAAKTYDLYRFDEKNGVWVNSRLETGANPDFTTIDKGVGYIYSNTTAADVAFAGEINVADVECNLTNGAAHGFNLIGNPFSQNIKLTDVTGVTLADGFYVLTNQNTWGTMIEAGTIAPLQGFLVQVDGDGGTATISKPTSSSKGERSNEQNTNIEMIVSNSIYRDNAFAMFGEGTGLNKVSHRNAQAPMLYVPQDGEDFAIAFMDENTTVFPVSFKAMTTGSYSISLKPTDDVSTLVLVDNMTGVETNMLLEDSYTFIGSPADNENRFTVKLTISNSQDEDEHFAYQNGSELVVNGEGTLQIFDILGRVVISEEVHGQTVNVGGLNTGAYIVRLTGESVKTQKIVVR